MNFAKFTACDIRSLLDKARLKLVIQTQLVLNNAEHILRFLATLFLLFYLILWQLVAAVDLEVVLHRLYTGRHLSTCTDQACYIHLCERGQDLLKLNAFLLE